MILPNYNNKSIKKISFLVELIYNIIRHTIIEHRNDISFKTAHKKYKN